MNTSHKIYKEMLLVLKAILPIQFSILIHILLELLQVRKHINNNISALPFAKGKP